MELFNKIKITRKKDIPDLFFNGGSLKIFIYLLIRWRIGNPYKTTLRQIAKELKMSPNTISRSLNFLCEKKYVYKKVLFKDKAKVGISILVVKNDFFE